MILVFGCISNQTSRTWYTCTNYPLYMSKTLKATDPKDCGILNIMDTCIDQWNIWDLDDCSNLSKKCRNEHIWCQTTGHCLLFCKIFVKYLNEILGTQMIVHLFICLFVCLFVCLFMFVYVFFFFLNCWPIKINLFRNPNGSLEKILYLPVGMHFPT